jgi:hypothetical protein
MLYDERNSACYIGSYAVAQLGHALTHQYQLDS